MSKVIFEKKEDCYVFHCTCGNTHQLSCYPLAQLEAGNDMTYTCRWNNKTRKVQLKSKQFKQL